MKGKKLTSLLLAGCMAASVLPATAWAADPAQQDSTRIEQGMRTVVDHGSCGDDATWIYYDNGTLEEP